MSGLNTNSHLLRQVQRKFDKLEEQSMDRYEVREEKVVAAIMFCVTALEQLQNWAMFAIFPQDEKCSAKYISFVEYKYQCVLVPLRNLNQAIIRNEILASSPRDAGDEIKRENSGYSIKEKSNHSESPRSGLRRRITNVTQKYITEGQTIKQNVLGKLQKNRKDIQILYRWGQSSLMDLHDIIDDTLADELYYSIRGKMTRIVSSMSEVEEVCDKIEKNLMAEFPQDDSEGTVTLDDLTSAFQEHSGIDDLTSTLLDHSKMDNSLNVDSISEDPPQKSETPLKDSVGSKDSARNNRSHSSNNGSKMSSRPGNLRETHREPHRDKMVTKTSDTQLGHMTPKQDIYKEDYKRSSSEQNQMNPKSPSATKCHNPISETKWEGHLTSMADMERKGHMTAISGGKWDGHLSSRSEGFVEGQVYDLDEFSEEFLTIRSKHVGYSSSGHQNDHITETVNGPPEPPNSPRPRGLLFHPKIAKDKLQSFNLPRKEFNYTW